VTVLIPPLRDLYFPQNGYDLPSGFAERFIKLHGQVWSIAEDHWEQIVARVLNTDAVSKKASGLRAMRQAVYAAGDLLTNTALAGRCPICKPRATHGRRAEQP
jgi:hypothetical protein